MRNLMFYDAAYPPPSEPPGMDGVAFYIGGDTPHVWTAAEIGATCVRYRLPIYVRSDPSRASAQNDASTALMQLRAIGAPRGCLVAWDTEVAADPGYMRAIFELIVGGGGYALIDYGSQSALFANELPVGGYYWGADWTGGPHVVPGDQMTQFAAVTNYDESEAHASLPFWDTRPTTPAPTSTPTAYQTETLMQQLPQIRQGATGAAVRTAQGLCIARGHLVIVDGIFGPATAAAIRDVQAAARISIDGIIGPRTWPVLLGIA